jgi:hypothetical protein|tara:strand:+ start:328 stop:537 length:210 start_codon:yes stop_codon:yes gene_type:complete
MIINKITVGYVIQCFDTKTSRCTGQSFIAGDIVDYEKPDGAPVESEKQIEKLGYLPFDMVQPILEELND